MKGVPAALIGAAHWLFTVKKEREIWKEADVMSNMKNGFLTCAKF